MKSAYLIAPVLLACAACDCDCDPPDLGSQYVVCSDDPSGSKAVVYSSKTGMPVSPSDVSPNFTASDWKCPQPKDSPIWTDSMGQEHSVSSGPKANSANRTAASTSSPRYLPQILLDLPFPARQGNGPNYSPACDSSWPTLFQVNHERATVNRISSCGFKTIAAIPVVSRPLQIAFTPDGLTALVTSFDNAVNFIDLSTNRVSFTLKTPFDVNPHGIAVSPDGARAYITSFNIENAQVATIDLPSRSIVSSIPVASYPQVVALTPDGTQLYVLFPLGNAVYIIDTLTNTIARTLNVAAPRGIAFNSTGSRAYVTSASGSPGSVIEISTDTLKTLRTFKTGTGPLDVAVLYGDAQVVVTNYEGKSISTITLNTETVSSVATQFPVTGLTVVR